MERSDGYGIMVSQNDEHFPYCQANLLCNADEFYCEGCKCMSCSIHGHCDFGGDPNCPWYIMGMAFAEADSV